jgi:hypothetical protein
MDTYLIRYASWWKDRRRQPTETSTGDTHPDIARDREAGLSSVDAFVLCALIVGAVAAASPAIAEGIQALAERISAALG